MFDVKTIKNDFPILSRKVNGKPLVYLDNGATSQKPKQVIKALVEYYENHNANIHRGIHTLGDESTRIYKESRKTVADFIGASDEEELVFVRNTTEAINLVARSWGEKNISKDDVILTSQMEHHSNIVPWQELVKKVGAKLRFVEVNQDGELDMEELEEKLKLKPKLVAIVQVSNFLGTVNPILEIVKKSKSVGAKVLVDGAQAVPHMKVDVSQLDVDFYAFSGHKMLAPMGIGGLYVKKEILKEMDPFLFGGGMISEVYEKNSVYADLPDRFDGGTPNVAGAFGLAAACKYLDKLGMENVRKHEGMVLDYAYQQLSNIDGVVIYGPLEKSKRGGVVSFTLEGVHAHDVAQVLDRESGVAVRSGHHCTMIMHKKLNLVATTRASFYIYNDKSDVDKLVAGINKAIEIFGGKTNG